MEGMKMAVRFTSTVEVTKTTNKTSIGSKPSLTKMNKHKRRGFKKYRGQGR